MKRTPSFTRYFPWWMMAIIMLAGSPPALADNTAKTILNMDRPIVIGHRGYKAFAPENTMPGIELGVSSGCDLIEFDVHFSRDRQAVVVHDRTLDRTTDVGKTWGSENVQVKTCLASDLKELDAGSWFHPRYGSTGLPDLREVLAYIRDHDAVGLVDRKAGTAEEFVSILHDMELSHSVIIQAFDWDFLKDANRLDEGLLLSAAGPSRTWKGKRLSPEERELDKEWIDRARQAGARALAWNDQVTSEAIAYAHRKNMKVWVYTINDAAEASRLLETGIDGIITDNPSIIWKAFFVDALEQTGRANEP